MLHIQLGNYIIERKTEEEKLLFFTGDLAKRIL